MKQTSAILAAAAFLIAPAAHATTPIDDFELNGSLSNSAVGGATLTNNGGTLGASGITFGSNQGPTVSGLTPLTAWTIDTKFSFDTLGGYKKIIDFSGLSSDTGVYALGSALSFFPNGSDGTADFVGGSLARLTVSRTAAGALTGWVNGTQVFTATDSSGAFDIPSALNFFQDDVATGGREAGSGFVDYLRIYDSALSPADAGVVGVNSAVPEPSTWAMMLLGFGLCGIAMRKRSTARTMVRYA